MLDGDISNERQQFFIFLQVNELLLVRRSRGRLATWKIKRAIKRNDLESLSSLVHLLPRGQALVESLMRNPQVHLRLIVEDRQEASLIQLNLPYLLLSDRVDLVNNERDRRNVLGYADYVFVTDRTPWDNHHRARVVAVYSVEDAISSLSGLVDWGSVR